MTVVEEAIEDRGGDHRIAKDLTPFAEALVGGEQDAAALVARRDQREKRRGREPIARPHAELVDDEELRGEVDAEPPLEAVLGLSGAQIFDELMSADEVHAVPLFDGAQSERDGEMSLADTG